MVLKRIHIDKDLPSDYRFNSLPVATSSLHDSNLSAPGSSIPVQTGQPPAVTIIEPAGVIGTDSLNRPAQGEHEFRQNIVSANANEGDRTSSLPGKTGASGGSRPDRPSTEENVPQVDDLSNTIDKTLLLSENYTETVGKAKAVVPTLGQHGFVHLETSQLQKDDETGPPLPPLPGTAQEEHYAGGIEPAVQGPPPSIDHPPQINETYQIKHIHWKDDSWSGQLRRTAILVQNANGPCPLLALVNALSLSTPVNGKSGLEKILRARERVSLGLLLDAVVDELIHRRGGDVAQGLPDVGDLYAFLTTLHTGMTVNPRFVLAPQTPPNLMDAPVDSVETNDTNGGDALVPGSFEETQGMQLYGTFSVPLLHGWLPTKDDPAYAALQRSARTYEDALSLMCQEEELEEKLRTEGLNRDEQQLLQDLVIVKYFLVQTATQLTTHGLDVLTRSMAPGAIFILFRNDHFSTIYKHPSSSRLLQLVTDMGYAAHEDVVWESLVDVTGEGSEFLTGDFRPVTGNMIEESRRSTSSSSVRNHMNDDGVNNTPPNGSGGIPSQTRNGATGIGSIDQRLDQSSTGLQTFAAQAAGSSNPNTEQEDHDLALALQLQEEEEDRHQRDVAARQREERLSREVLSHQVAHASPRRRSGRRAGGRGGQVVRSLVPPQTTNQSRPVEPRPVSQMVADAPPPSYEQAAGGTPYYPPPDHPAHPSSPASRVVAGEQTAENERRSGPNSPQPSRGGRMGTGRPVMVGYRGQSSFARVQTPGRASRQSMGTSSTTGSEATDGSTGKRDCVVM